MSKQSVIKLPIWKPKQQLIWDSKATELLIAGDTRAGKSFFIRKAYVLWCSQIFGLVTDILRLNYEDVINNYMVGETSFPELLKQWEKDKIVKINSDNILFQETGSVIKLGHCADDKIARKHQGNAVHVRTLDESAQLPENRIRGLTGWITLSDEMLRRIPEQWRGMFPKFYHLTNFIGPGMGYYRRGFLEPREPLEIEQVGQFKRQYIPMYLTDNDSEDAAQTIARIKEAFPDPATQKALLECNWRAAVGDFFPEWSEQRHVIPDIDNIPSHLIRYSGHDWGTADPACFYWAFISDGEAFEDSRGRSRWFPRGAIVIYREWYICDPYQPSKGARLRNEEMASGYLDRTEQEYQEQLVITDSLPFQDRGGPTIASIYHDHKVRLVRGDTSRIPGWSQVRSRLNGIVLDVNDLDENGTPIKLPLLYVAESCEYLRRAMPALTRHKSELKSEDAVESGEATHATDTVRLICMTNKIALPKKPVKQEPLPPPHLRKSTTPDQILKQIKKQKARARGR